MKSTLAALMTTVVLMAVGPAPAQAFFLQDAAPEASLCMTGSSPEQVACLQEQYAQSEANLTEAYDLIIEYFQSKQEFANPRTIYFQNLESRLRISQRLWIRDREAQCEFEATALSSTQHVIPTTIRCQIAVANARTVFLSTFIKIPAEELARLREEAANQALNDPLGPDLDSAQDRTVLLTPR